MQNVSNYWSGDMDGVDSYLCNSTETLYQSDSSGAKQLTKLTVSNMLLQAFHNTTTAEFAKPGLSLAIIFI